MCVVVSWQTCAWTLLCVMVTQQEWTYCGLAPPWSLTLVRGLRFLNSDFFYIEIGYFDSDISDEKNKKQILFEDVLGTLI